MSTVHERLYIEAPYTQAAGALEQRLGLAPGSERGSCTLTLVAPAQEGRELARVVTVATGRVAEPANYVSHYTLRWDSGHTPRGVPTPGFAGTLTLSAGQDYGECALDLEGQYDPPGGAAGKIFDEVVGRRIAHATLSALLDAVGQELQREHAVIEAAKHTNGR
jgi:hypothetical protein